MRVEEKEKGIYLKQLEPHERQLLQMVFSLQQSIESQFGEIMRRLDDLETRVEALEENV